MRRRASILIRHAGHSIVIDTGPDYRSQALSAGIKSLDAVLLTHLHADHCHGIDDLRAYFFWKKKPIKCYVSNMFEGELRNKFPYIFEKTAYKGVKPHLEIIPISQEPFDVLGLPCQMYTLPHGEEQVNAFRFGNFMYATDFKGLSSEVIGTLRGKVDTFLASAVHHSPHHSHNTFQEIINIFRDLKVRRGIITHISHEIEHEEEALLVPSNVGLAYDGMQFDITPY